MPSLKLCRLAVCLSGPSVDVGFATVRLRRLGAISVLGLFFCHTLARERASLSITGTALPPTGVGLHVLFFHAAQQQASRASQR